MFSFDLLSSHGSGSAQNLSVIASEINSRNSGKDFRANGDHTQGTRSLCFLKRRWNVEEDEMTGLVFSFQGTRYCVPSQQDWSGIVGSMCRRMVQEDFTNKGEAVCKDMINRTRIDKAIACELGLSATEAMNKTAEQVGEKVRKLGELRESHLRPKTGRGAYTTKKER